jgi:hypothetical protein
MRRRSRTLLSTTCFLVLVLTLGLAAPAMAQSRVVRDHAERSPVPARYDVTSVRLTNTERAVTAVFHVRRVVKAQSLFLVRMVAVTPGRPAVTIEARTLRRSGRLVNRMTVQQKEGGGFGAPTAVRCPTLRARWRAGTNGTVTLRLPVSCISATATPVAWKHFELLAGDPRSSEGSDYLVSKRALAVG